MSAEATGWVWRHSPLTGSQLNVHLAIADVVNDVHDYQFWMSTEALAKKARCSRNTVTTTLTDLVNRGMLTVVTAGKDLRKPTVYAFAPLARSGEAHARFEPPTSAVSAHITKGTELTEEAASAVSAHVDARSRVVARCDKCGNLTWDCSCKATTDKSAAKERAREALSSLPSRRETKTA